MSLRKSTDSKIRSSARSTAYKKEPRSVFYDLYPNDVAAELEMRSALLSALQCKLKGLNIAQSDAMTELGATRAQVLDIKRGKISRFTLERLVRMACRAGLRPKVTLAA